MHSTRRLSNQILSDFLRLQRLKSLSSMSIVASKLKIPISEIASIEKAPAEVPLNRLYVLIENYGSEAILEASEVFLQISLLNHRFRKARFKYFYFQMHRVFWKAKTIQQIMKNLILLGVKRQKLSLAS